MVEYPRQDWYCGNCRVVFRGCTETDRCGWCLGPVQDPKALRPAAVEAQATILNGNGAHP
jgi:hypothetical protein